MTKGVTDIRDAKALREMGIPMNTPVVDGGDLPAAAGKAVNDGFKAAIAFRKRVAAYEANQNASTGVALRRAFDRFMAKTVSDDPIGAALLESEFASVRAEWAEAFERVDGGEEIQIGPPMWPWEETEATKRRRRNPGL